MNQKLLIIRRSWACWCLMSAMLWYDMVSVKFNNSESRYRRSLPLSLVEILLWGWSLISILFHGFIIFYSIKSYQKGQLLYTTCPFLLVPYSVLSTIVNSWKIPREFVKEIPIKETRNKKGKHHFPRIIGIQCTYT